MKNSSYVI